MATDLDITDSLAAFRNPPRKRVPSFRESRFLKAARLSVIVSKDYSD